MEILEHDERGVPNKTDEQRAYQGFNEGELVHASRNVPQADYVRSRHGYTGRGRRKWLASYLTVRRAGF